MRAAPQSSEEHAPCANFCSKWEADLRRERAAVMKLVEYQGKELLKRVGIPVPRGEHAASARAVAAFIAANPGSWVLKAQVQMGGRGKAGGIKFADNPDEAQKIAEALLGTTLRGIQNPEGELVKSLLVEEKVDIAHEAYVSITIDRAQNTGRTPQSAISLSKRGGSSTRRSCRAATRRNGRRFSARSTGFFLSTAPTSSRSIRWCLAKTAARSRRMRRSISTTTRSTSMPSSRRGRKKISRLPTRTNRRRSRSGWGAPIMRSSTATSASWRTAPDSAWGRWTRFATPAAKPRISWTSAAARKPSACANATS